ncbi:hypothetical protein C8J57DRAFT_426278 [Mycena rebaudengoi]|nr:hypothetical protein C8J57DRAFT_426278 [Mycena rebaudengoi]
MAASSTDKELTISPRIHPECELVARVVGDAEPLANEDLIPYVFSSKLHCYPCYLWLQGFNERRPSSSKVAFDGCHGSLTPGWLPPTSKDESILARMRSQIESELSEYTFRKQLWSMSFDMSNAMATAPTNEDREDVAAHLDEKELLLCN